MLQNDKPGLYGITTNNSSRHGDDLWGKNQFNSTFPLALCLFMRDKRISPVSVVVSSDKTGAKDEHWQMEDVVGSSDNNPFYEFETEYEPYSAYARNERDSIDLVVRINGKHTIPLEVKLTVIPDSSSAKKRQDLWAPELVIRPVSSAYAMMGIATSLLNSDEKRPRAISLLRQAYNKVSSWNNETEIMKHASKLTESLDAVITLASDIQRPFLVQPIWRTVGQSFVLCEMCFDVFVWSDAAVLSIPVRESRKSNVNKMTRSMREIARHVRGLYDILQTGDFDYTGIYKGMGLGYQTDKAFTINGSKSLRYLQHKRLDSPAISRDSLADIVLNGGSTMLRPERRFDAAVVAHISKT